jgi:hypothetical protein
LQCYFVGGQKHYCAEEINPSRKRARRLQIISDFLKTPVISISTPQPHTHLDTIESTVGQEIDYRSGGNIFNSCTPQKTSRNKSVKNKEFCGQRQIRKSGSPVSDKNMESINKKNRNETPGADTFLGFEKLDTQYSESSRSEKRGYEGGCAGGSVFEQGVSIYHTAEGREGGLTTGSHFDLGKETDDASDDVFDNDGVGDDDDDDDEIIVFKPLFSKAGQCNSLSSSPNEANLLLKSTDLDFESPSKNACDVIESGRDAHPAPASLFFSQNFEQDNIDISSTSTSRINVSNCPQTIAFAGLFGNDDTSIDPRNYFEHLTDDFFCER